MTALIAEPQVVQELIERRKALGLDGHDEVWDDVYFMAPIANDEHQHIQSRLGAILELVIGFRGLGLVRAGVNVADRDSGWTQNYRVPDLVVFRNGTSAVNRGAYWLGGPDLAVEILSEGDRAREKFLFYAAVGVRELLLIDRDPWRLELYRLKDGRLEEVGRSEVPGSARVVSEVVTLSFRLIAGAERPQIEVREAGSDQVWVI